MIDVCESAGFLQALSIIKTIITILKIVIPLILIFLLSLDVYKLISDPSNTKAVFPLVKKRLLAAIIIFFIPSIVSLLLHTIGKGSDYERCYNNANSDYIENIKDKQAAKQSHNSGKF